MYIDTLPDPVRDAARLLWDYHRVGIVHPVGQYDLLLVTGSHDLGVADYLSIVTNPQRALSIMVGDTQRIRVYGKAGYLTPQPMPKAVLDATAAMLAAGFDQFAVT